MSDDVAAQKAAALNGRIQREIAYEQRQAGFKKFFAGLIFATLSFIGTHTVVTKLALLKIFEAPALFLLFIAGIILLFQLAEYRVNFERIRSQCGKRFFKNIFEVERWYWVCFIFGMLLMVINRILLMFIN